MQSLSLSTDKNNLQPSPRLELPQAWASFLSQPRLEAQWDVYGSLTHPGYPHPETLHKAFLRFTDTFNRHSYGSRYWKTGRGITWARASERQARGSLHYHFLLGSLNPELKTRQFLLHAFNVWKDLTGANQAELEVYRKEAGAEFYMSKDAYAWKHGEIDLSPNLKQVLDGSKVSADARLRESVEDYRGSLTLRGKDVKSYTW